MNKELLKGLSEEQIAKIKDCKNNEELLAIAKEEGIELTDEQLDAVSGGCDSEEPTHCPNCGATENLTAVDFLRSKYQCARCGNYFNFYEGM